jgi:hypothetical protein
MRSHLVGLKETFRLLRRRVEERLMEASEEFATIFEL